MSATRGRARAQQRGSALLLKVRKVKHLLRVFELPVLLLKPRVETRRRAKVGDAARSLSNE